MAVRHEGMRGFQPSVANKVERLLDVLEEMGRHPDLTGKLAMHGGTAINLFMLNAPRLSVDIDLSYIAKLQREDMLADKVSVERGIEEVASGLGYSVSSSSPEIAGRTFFLRYHDEWGQDQVKIDIVYLNRSPLLPVEPMHCRFRPDLGVPMFSDKELIGGKVKAFYDRVKIRDLYDIVNLKSLLDGWPASETEIAHKIILFYASISARFPNEFEGRASERFLGKQRELEDQLHPVLRMHDNKPELEMLVRVADHFIDEYVLPRNDAESLFLDRFASGVFEPELVFGLGDTANAAHNSPQAQWKLENIRRM